MMRYDYECTEHGVFEVQKPAADRHTAECPSCGLVCQKLFSKPREIIVPGLFGHDKAGIREVTGGHSMNDIRHNPELRRRFLDGD